MEWHFYTASHRDGVTYFCTHIFWCQHDIFFVNASFQTWTYITCHFKDQVFHYSKTPLNAYIITLTILSWTVGTVHTVVLKNRSVLSNTTKKYLQKDFNEMSINNVNFAMTKIEFHCRCHYNNSLKIQDKTWRRQIIP